jgi:hypothetical protein
MQYFFPSRSDDKEPSKIYFNKFGVNLSIQTFSKPFLFSKSKEKFEKESSYCYWAGPRESAGPLSHLAYAARAKGREGGPAGRRPMASWPGSVEAKAMPTS